MSNIVNKIKDTVDPDRCNRTTTTTTTRTTHHPNAVGGDNGLSAGSGAAGTGYTTSGAGYGNNNVPEGTYGPHNSRIANTLDPRVDSDRDNRTAGAGVPGGYVGSSASTGYKGGVGYNNTASRTAPESIYGSLSSRVPKTLDPRVDSNIRAGATTGATTAGTTGCGPEGVYNQRTAGRLGGTGGVGASVGNFPGPAPTTAGPHRSDILNKLDPRIDSKQSGPAPNTAGPHRTDVMNELDPRVESQPGRRTGGNY